MCLTLGFILPVLPNCSSLLRPSGILMTFPFIMSGFARWAFYVFIQVAYEKVDQNGFRVMWHAIRDFSFFSSYPHFSRKCQAQETKDCFSGLRYPSKAVFLNFSMFFVFLSKGG